VDRGALDAALNSKVSCGGWCPEGRKAEDGVIPDVYPVQELKGGGYLERTLKNVLDSDGTVIIYFGSLSGGTEQTHRYCLNNKKPYLLLDGMEVKPDRAAERIKEFLNGLPGETLNCAGSRGSNHNKAYSYALKTITMFIELYKSNISNNEN